MKRRMIGLDFLRMIMAFMILLRHMMTLGGETSGKRVYPFTDRYSYEFVFYNVRLLLQV